MTLKFLDNENLVIGGGDWETVPLRFSKILRIGGGIEPTWRDVVISGTGSVTLVNAKANGLSYVKLFGDTELLSETYLDTITLDGACEQRNVPVGYKELVGITMNNNCYYEITGFKMRGSDTTRFSFEYGGDTCNVFGCYTTASAQDNYSLFIGTATTARYLRYNGGTYNSRADADTRYDVVFTSTGTTGMKVDSTWDEKDFTTSVDLCIGITGTTATSAKFIGNLYGHFVVDGRLHLVPVERESDNEICYYDQISGNIYEPTGTTPTSLGYVTTPTPTTPISIVCNNGFISMDAQGQVTTIGTQEVVTDNVGNTATAQNLLAIGNYKDTQEILSGAVTRNVNLIILDGTENWQNVTSINNFFYITQNDIDYTATSTAISTHYVGVMPNIGGSNQADKTIKAGFYGTQSQKRLYIKDTSFSTASELKAWLTQQYTNGTPVIVAYPITPATTETVSSQVLQKSPITQTAGSISNMTITTTQSSHTTPTPYAPLALNCNNGVIGVNAQGQITVTGTTETVQVKDDNDTVLGMATAQMLLKISTYQDVHSVINGTVTRKCGIKVFDGTENWLASPTTGIYYIGTNDALKPVNNVALLSTHFEGTINPHAQMADNKIKLSTQAGSNYGAIYIKMLSVEDLTGFKAFLVEQYTKGTPLVVIYPLATATTASVTAQPLTIQEGTNIVEISQASMNNLSLEVKYKAGVTVTVEEIEAVNLDNDVEVTING